MASNYDWTQGLGMSGVTSPPVDPLTGQTNFMSMLNPMASVAPSINAVAPATFSATPDTSMLGGIKDWFSTSGVLGSKLPDGTQVSGWGMPALSVASGLSNAFFGMKQLSLAQDTLEQNKRQFQLNFDAQRKTTNAALADRQAARVASNPNAYQSVSDYMGKYGI